MPGFEKKDIVMPLAIDFYGEISCPWCLIALHRLDNVLARDLAGVSVQLRHFPVLLGEGLPKEGIAVDDIFRERHGGRERSATFARPEAEARSAGIALSLARQPRVFDTTAAHTLVRLAAQGRQHALAVAITDAYFLEGIEMGNLEALATIASRHGIERGRALAVMNDPAELRLTAEMSRDARRRGIGSVPLIAFPDGSTLQTSSEAELAEAVTRNLVASSTQS